MIIFEIFVFVIVDFYKKYSLIIVLWLIFP